MKATTLPDVYRVLKEGGEPVSLSAEILVKARGCIDAMLELG